MADDIEIRIRVGDHTATGFRDVNGRLRDMRGRFVSEGNLAGQGFGGGISRGLSSAIPRFVQLSGVASSLYPVIVGAVSAVQQLAGAALVLPGIFSSAAAAASTLQMALGGVGDAFSAFESSKSGGGGGGGGGGNGAARAIRDATDAVNDARRNAARVAEDTARDIQRAERDVARVSAESAAEISRAKEEQDRVEATVAESISRALEQQTEATEALDDARKESARTLDDLRERVSDYGLEEEGARLRLLAAQAAQRKVTADATATNLEKAQSAHNVREAEERLSDVQRNRAQDTAKLTEEEAKGVEGSDKVVAAQKRAEDAADAVAEAREDGADREAAASARVAAAIESGDARIAASKEALADTERAADRQREDAAESVSDALQRLRDAEQDAASGAGAAAGGVDKFAEALAKLSPNAREFVLAVLSMRDSWNELKMAVQDAFFEGFGAKVKQLGGTYIPVLKTGMVAVAEAMNKMALYAADALMDPQVVAAVSKVFDNTAQFLTNATTALGDFLAGFAELAGIGSDYLPGIGTWLAEIAKQFRSWVETNPDGIRTLIDDALTGLGTLWDIVTNLYDTFMELFGDGSGQGFLDNLKDITEFLNEIAPVIRTIADASPVNVVSTVAETIRESFTALEEWWTGLWGDEGTITTTFGAAWESMANAWTWCADTLSSGWTWLSSTAASVWGRISSFLGTVWDALVGAWEWCRAAVAAGWTWVSSTAQAIWGRLSGFLGTIWNALVSAWEWCRGIVVGGWNYIVGIATSIASRIGSAFQAGWDAIVNGATWAVNTARNILNRIIDGVNGAISGLNMLPGVAIGYVPHFAQGGVAGGGMAMVGERGPELVRLPAGSRVHTAGDSRRMMAHGGGATSVAVQLVAGENARDAFASMIMRMIREGDLQLVPAS